MQLKYYKVSDIESERGWGQKVDETHYFRTEQEAKDYVKKFNASNTQLSVPDWYMYATDPTTEYIDETLAQLIFEDMKKTTKPRRKNGRRAGVLVGS